MDFQEIVNQINQLEAEYGPGQIPEQERMALEDTLMNAAWQCARLLDRLSGVDIYNGSNYTYGTPNHRSKTYKVRKALGYSYP